MATATPTRVLLATTSWRSYVAVSEALGEDNPGLRVAFDAQTMEIMSPSFDHERIARLMDYLVTRAFDLSGADAVSAGSTTYRREDVQKGAEPDLCFYVDRPAVRLQRTIDLSVAPAPDLLVEIDLSAERMSKRAIYAALGVAEIWRFDGTRLCAQRLVAGEYSAIEASILLPWLPLYDITARIERMYLSSNAQLRLDWDAHIMGLLANVRNR